MRRLILLILTIIGVAFLIPTIAMLGIFHQQTQGMIPVEGVIADWAGDRPVIAYAVDGQEYTAMMSVSSSVHWAVGSPYRVMVDPVNPTRASDYFFALMGGIFGVTAFILLATGFIISFIMRKNERRREDILQYGLRTAAIIVELRQNYSVRVNGRHPWVAIAVCTHPSTREEMTLQSHMLWHPAVAEGDKVDVAFDPMDERRYAMDIPEATR